MREGTAKREDWNQMKLGMMSGAGPGRGLASLEESHRGARWKHSKMITAVGLSKEFLGSTLN